VASTRPRSQGREGPAGLPRHEVELIINLKTAKAPGVPLHGSWAFASTRQMAGAS
jgi:hypothetical protein